MSTVMDPGQPDNPGGGTAAEPAGARPARRGRRRRALALTGLALTAAGALAAASVATVLALRPRPAPRRPHPLRGTVFTLRPGQCADTAPNGVAAARVVPCAQPHEIEIYGAFRVAGRGWPGRAALASRARQGCAARLSDYVNPQLAASLTQAYVYPDQGAWGVGERTVVCEIRAAAGSLTGSVRAFGG